MRRTRWLAALLALASIIPPGPLGGAASPESQKGLQRLRLITFTVDPATVAAQARGFFAAEGLDVELVVTPNSTVQMQGLANGEYEVASTAFDNVLGWSGRAGGPGISAGVAKETGGFFPD